MMQLQDILFSQGFGTRRVCLGLVQQGLVLVGDAAHSINPLAGQGVNLGFADAMLLSELLEKAFAQGKSLADPELLQHALQEVLQELT